MKKIIAITALAAAGLAGLAGTTAAASAATTQPPPMATNVTETYNATGTSVT